MTDQRISPELPNPDGDCGGGSTRTETVSLQERIGRAIALQQAVLGNRLVFLGACLLTIVLTLWITEHGPLERRYTNAVRRSWSSERNDIWFERFIDQATSTVDAEDRDSKKAIEEEEEAPITPEPDRSRVRFNTTPPALSETTEDENSAIDWQTAAPSKSQVADEGAIDWQAEVPPTPHRVDVTSIGEIDPDSLVFTFDGFLKSFKVGEILRISHLLWKRCCMLQVGDRMYRGYRIVREKNQATIFLPSGYALWIHRDKPFRIGVWGRTRMSTIAKILDAVNDVLENYREEQSQ